jgi:hypothetical protein
MTWSKIRTITVLRVEIQTRKSVNTKYDYRLICSDFRGFVNCVQASVARPWPVTNRICELDGFQCCLQASHIKRIAPTKPGDATPHILRPL